MIFSKGIHIKTLVTECKYLYIEKGFNPPDCPEENSRDGTFISAMIGKLIYEMPCRESELKPLL